MLLWLEPPRSVKNLREPMANANLKLDPDAVRRRASTISGCVAVAVPNAPSSVCSFVVGCHGEGASEHHSFATMDRNVARVTIYCDTGTVATGRVLAGSVRHTFRKNVSNLDSVERCLRHPAELPVIDWQLVSLSDENDEKRNAISSKAGDHPSKSVTKNSELIEVGMAILQGEREKLVQHVKALENAAPRRKEESESSDDPGYSGLEFQFSLAAAAMKHVDQCLNDIQKMGKLVHGISTNGVGTVFLYGNGGVAYTPSIPRALYQRLSQLRNSKLHSTRPAYVSLGTKDRYFVAFHDGTFNCKGPKGLERELKKLTAPPRSVAFGSSYDTFFIVFHDGSWKYQGKGIPDELEDKLEAHREKTCLACVNLGPAREWFLRSQAGRVGWGGVSDEMNEAIEDLLEDGHSLNFLDFGECGSYFISYD